MISAKKTGWLVFVIILLTAYISAGQDTLTNPRHSSGSSVNSKALEVEKSVATESPAIVAAKYEGLAAELAAKGSYAKAEEYLKSALKIYKKEKNKDKIAS